MKYNLLLDPGHGDRLWGHYLTPGKRSPDVPPGIYEGEYNRHVSYAIEQSVTGGVSTLNPGPMQIGDRTKIKYINDLWTAGSRFVLVCLHCNASRKQGWQPDNGFVVFHSSNASQTSKNLALQISLKMGTYLPRIKPRYKTGIKTRDLSILKKTLCPAVYFEMFFMTSLDDLRESSIEMLATVVNKAWLAINKLENK